MRLLTILFLGAMAIPSFAQYREVRTLQQPKETNYRDQHLRTGRQGLRRHRPIQRGGSL